MRPNSFSTFLTSSFLKGIPLGLLIILWVHPALTQSSVSITGQVVDENNIPIEFANVLLSSPTDSINILQAAETDSNGFFAFKKTGLKTYRLKVSMIGFQHATAVVEPDTLGTTTLIPPIRLSIDPRLLNEVKVISYKDIVRNTPTGFIINTSDNLTQAGGTATDLLSNTPTVVVDAEGGITIRGKAPLIKVNGRNLAIGTTDRIPASSVESIEIINNPSAKYDADAEGGIINITLKKNTLEGLNTSIALGGGYGANGRINSSLLMNYKNEKWNVGLAYNNRFANRTRMREASRINFEVPEAYYLTQHRVDERYEQTQDLKLNLDYQPNEKNNFNFEAIGNTDGEDNDENLTSLIETQENNFISQTSRRSIEITREKLIDLSLNHTLLFKDERRSLSTNISTTFPYATENTDITTQPLDEENNEAGSPLLQRTYNDQNSNVTNINIDYSHPLTPSSLIEAGYKGILRTTNADFQSQYYVNDAYVTNPAASNVYDFQEHIHAAYIQYNGFRMAQDVEKWKYTVGVRGEKTDNQSHSGENQISGSQEYFSLFPSANLAYYINTNDYLKLSFSRRINRPDLDELNPFIDITDSLNQHGGNPNLQPEYIQSYEFGHNKTWSKASLSSALFYRHTTDIIFSYTVVDSLGVGFQQPQNFGNAITYGIEEIGSAFLFPFWNANLSFSLYRQLIQDSKISEEVDNDVVSWYGKLVNNFVLWKDSQIQLFTNYNSPIGTAQGKRVGIFYMDIGFRQKFPNGRGALGLVITDIFNTQKYGGTASGSNFTQTRISKSDTRSIMLTLAYSFGSTFKEDILENKFKND